MGSCLRIYIGLVFPLVDVHSLPLSPRLSIYSKYLYFFGKNYFFVCVYVGNVIVMFFYIFFSLFSFFLSHYYLLFRLICSNLHFFFYSEREREREILH